MKSREILVPLEATPESERILPYAKRLAAAAGVPIRLVVVANPDNLRTPEQGGESVFIDHLAQRVEEVCHRYLSGVASRIEGPGVELATEVLLGTSIEPLAAFVRKREPWLVALGVDTSKSWRQMVFDSPFALLWQETRTPLLVVDGSLQPSLTQNDVLGEVIVAIDGTKESEVVLYPVAEIATFLGIPITIMAPSSFSLEFDEGPEEHLELLERRLQRRGLQTGIVRAKGDLRRQAALAAQVPPARLLALTSGHGSIWSLASLLSLLQRSRGPVLLAHTPPERQQVRMKVIGSQGQCLLGYKEGDEFVVTVYKGVEPRLCQYAQDVLWRYAQAKSEGAFVEDVVACPAFDHLLMFKFEPLPHEESLGVIEVPSPNPQSQVAAQKQPMHHPCEEIDELSSFIEPTLDACEEV
jgi:uncharacterized repeat protein (TIGR04076 family)